MLLVEEANQWPVYISPRGMEAIELCIVVGKAAEPIRGTKVSAYQARKRPNSVAWNGCIGLGTRS